MSESDHPVRSLREWRTRVYFESQAEFAQRLEVDASTLSLWESGKRRPRFSSWRRIAEKLNLQPDQIGFPDDAKEDRE